MTNEEILEEQVEALEKLLQLKQAIINELEEKVNRLQPGYVVTNTPNFVPSVFSPITWQCTDGNPHQYPQYWNSVTPPCCSKCGQQASNNMVTVSGQSVTIPGHTHTTGYFQPLNVGNQLEVTSGQADASNNIKSLTFAAK